MVKLSSEKENKKLHVRRLVKQRYHRELDMSAIKDRTRRSKNDSRILVEKKNKLYEWETTCHCIVAERK